MARLRTDNVFGTLTNNPLTNVGTTMNSAGLANLAAVLGGIDYAAVTLDPNRVHGAPEIVYVASHAGAATTATIQRGQEGTAARQHPSGTFWAHAPTVVDHRPFSPPSCRVFHTVNQSTTTAVEFVMLWNSENWDTAAMHSTASLTDRITVPVAGLYHVHCSLSYTSNATGNRYSSIKKNGTIYVVEDVRVASSGITTIVPLSFIDKANVGDYYSVQAYQTSGAALNVLGNGFGATWIGEG